MQVPASDSKACPRFPGIFHTVSSPLDGGFEENNGLKVKSQMRSERNGEDFFLPLKGASKGFAEKCVSRKMEF